PFWIHFRPPLALLALLALYWSTQVCSRALLSLSFEYFESTLLGNTAGPADAAGAASFLASLVASFFVSLDAAAGAASAPHWALRKSFHFWPLSVPAALAA